MPISARLILPQAHEPADPIGNSHATPFITGVHHFATLLCVTVRPFHRTGLGPPMSQPLSRSASRVQQAIEKRGFDFIVQELPKSTRTAQEAAESIGCAVGQIVKSLIFRVEETDEPILALVAGSNRVDMGKLAAVGSGNLAKADADFARRVSGYAIGGIPPCGHDQVIRTFIDEKLLEFDRVWAAAGTPNAVFELDPSALLPLTSGVVCDLHTD